MPTLKPHKTKSDSSKNLRRRSANYNSEHAAGQNRRSEPSVEEQNSRKEGAGSRSRQSANRRRKSNSRSASHHKLHKHTDVVTYKEFKRQNSSRSTGRQSGRRNNERRSIKSPRNINIASSSHNNDVGPNIAVREKLLQSSLLFGNLDKLVTLLEKHCQKCPEFAREIEQLNLNLPIAANQSTPLEQNKK